LYVASITECHASIQKQGFYARELAYYIARISYGNSVCRYVCLSVCHNPVLFQDQVR